MAIGKRDINYFEYFNQAVALSSKAAKQLEELMNNYTDVGEKADRIHDIEHEADNILHTVTSEVSKAFITPIDREDILRISGEIDDVVDNIEDVSNMLDMFSITAIPAPAKEMTALLVKACLALEKAVNEFKNFKKSDKLLSQLIIEVNRYEEEADRFYRKTIKELYLNEKDAVELAKWKEIYDKMEETLDACEDIANLLEVLSIKNS